MECCWKGFPGRLAFRVLLNLYLGVGEYVNTRGGLWLLRKPFVNNVLYTVYLLNICCKD